MKNVSERAVVLLIAAVQFVNILEFMMVMPLGPDFAKDLGIGLSHLGVIGGSYTAAAAISGLVASTFIERFDRRKALAFAMGGLVCATIIGGFAFNLTSLLCARVLAGMFGGPATSLSLAIVADTIPPERRGKAMSIVMMAFSVASIFGLPVGLELARIGSWRSPFFAVAGLGIVIAGFALFKLPSLTVHLQRAAERRAGGGKDGNLRDMLGRPVVWVSYTLVMFAMGGMFMIVPNLSAYIQGNMAYPRADMGILYLVGGLASFAIMRPIGWLTDKYGSFSVGTFGSVTLIAIIYVGFVNPPVGISVLAIFTAFMMSSSFRNIPFQTLTSQVPRPHERARFMSIQSAVQHMSAAAGAFLSSELLSEGANHELIGMPTVATLSMIFTATMPFTLYYVQKAVRRERAALMPSPSAAPLAPAQAILE